MVKHEDKILSAILGRNSKDDISVFLLMELSRQMYQYNQARADYLQ
jgi:hypothetical protein